MKWENLPAYKQTWKWQAGWPQYPLFVIILGGLRWDYPEKYPELPTSIGCAKSAFLALPTCVKEYFSFQLHEQARFQDPQGSADLPLRGLPRLVVDRDGSVFRRPPHHRRRHVQPAQEQVVRQVRQEHYEGPRLVAGHGGAFLGDRHGRRKEGEKRNTRGQC